MTPTNPPSSSAATPREAEHHANYPAAFAAAAARFPDRIAIEMECDGRLESISYADLLAWSLRMAAWFEAKEVQPGDRVAILADNNARWVASYLGALTRGAVAVPLDTSYKPAQIETLRRQSGARALVTSSKYLPAAREAAGEVQLATLDDTEEEVESLASLFQTGKAESPLPCPRERSDPAVILYTSGTTSDPKGVILTHGNLLSEFEAVRQVLPISEEDAVLGVLPLFHALAQMANLLLPLAVGARVVYLETLGTAELLHALAERGITIFACVPQFFYLIHQRVMEKAASSKARAAIFRSLLRVNDLARRFGCNLGPRLFAPVHKAFGSHMRLLITGGSRFEPTVARDFYALGFTVLEAYGLTETSGAATLMRPGERIFGCVGRPLPATEIRIGPCELTEDADTSDDRPADGEVLIRGPLVMAGYFERPDATAAVLRDGWFHSGDLGYLDDAGRLCITGRSKEIIVTSSGKNIYPEEIEAHYLKSGFIKELCVVPARRAGAPSAERLHAIIVPDMEQARSRKVLNVGSAIRFELEGLSAELPPQKRVLSYDIWTDPLPRTTTRKLKRFEIERRMQQRKAEAGERAKDGSVTEGAAPSAEPVAWPEVPRRDELLRLIRPAVADPASLRPDANLELDCGLDSMERVELLARLEQHLGVRVDPETANRIYTVGDLLEALRDAPAADTASTSGGAASWDGILAAIPPDDPDLAALTRPAPLRAAFFFGLMKASLLFWKLLCGLRVEGRDRLDRTGEHGFIIAPNHQSYLDAFLLVALLPYPVFRRLFFVGASEYFASPLRRRLARAIRLVPVDPDTHLTRAMQAGASGLRQGLTLILFPEGGRSIDGTLKTFRKGAGILSQHTESPVVPVAIRGCYELWPRSGGFQWRRLLPGRSRVRVVFGEALSAPAPLPGEATQEEVEQRYLEITESLRAAVQDLWDTAEAGAE